MASIPYAALANIMIMFVLSMILNVVAFRSSYFDHIQMRHPTLLQCLRNNVEDKFGAFKLEVSNLQYMYENNPNEIIKLDLDEKVRKLNIITKCFEVS